MFIKHYDPQAQRVAAKSGSIFDKSSSADFVPGGSCDTLNSICEYKHTNVADIKDCMQVNSTPVFNKIVSDAKSIDELKQKCATTNPASGCFEKPGPPTCKTVQRGIHV